MSNQTIISRREFLAGTSLALCTTALLGGLLVAQGVAGYQLGCYTRPWDQWDYKVALDGIAEAGFKYAGLMTAQGKSSEIIAVDSTPEEVKTIAQAAQRRGLQILSIYGGDFPVGRSVEAGIDGLKKLIDYCVICSCPNLLLGGTTEEKLFESYYKVVAECCDYAQSRKVGLSIKPHGGQNATGPQCRKIIDRLGRKVFRLWYDPGNIFYYSDGSLNPVEDASTVDGLVVGMSVKDFLPPKEVLVTPGTGKVDFRAVMARLRQGGFRSGPVVVECLAKCDTPDAVTLEAVKTRKFLQGLLDLKD